MSDEIASVIIPSHFRNDRLRRTLQSVHEQEYEPIEIIVIDDSGTGHARDVIAEFEDVLYIQLPENRGAQAARNVGLEVATGEYVRFLDDDDRLRPMAISKQMAALREHPDAGVAFCGIEYDSGDVYLPPPEVAGMALERALGFWNNIWRYSTLLVERSALDAIGPLAEVDAAGDIWVRIELARTTEFVAIPEPLVLVGEGDDHLGLSWKALESRRKLLDRYEPFYDELDPTVHRHALMDTNRLEALLYLNEHRWSPRAIAAFARTAYYTPTNRPQHVAELLASLLGQPGHERARKIRRSLLRRVGKN